MTEALCPDLTPAVVLYPADVQSRRLCNAAPATAPAPWRQPEPPAARRAVSARSSRDPLSPPPTPPAFHAGRVAGPLGERPTGPAGRTRQYSFTTLARGRGRLPALRPFDELENQPQHQGNNLADQRQNQLYPIHEQSPKSTTQ